LFDSHRGVHHISSAADRQSRGLPAQSGPSAPHFHRPDGGWGELVPAPHLSVLPIPGDHGSALFERRRADVAAVIQQALQQADGY
jgi:thioesterase domain-containing protein